MSKIFNTVYLLLLFLNITSPSDGHSYRSYGYKNINSYSQSCIDYRWGTFMEAPCTTLTYYKRVKRRRRWTREKKTYRKCTAYTCDTVDCDSDIARKYCPQTCGWCTTLSDELNANFTAFASFLDQLGLDYKLRSPEQRTVFAPDDATFTDFLENSTTVIDYTDIDQWRAHMVDLALYHIVHQRLTTDNITDGMEVCTSQGTNITFTVDNGTVFVNNDSEITTPDIDIRNGVVHSINNVLLPPSALTTTWEYLDQSASHTTFFELLENANFTFLDTDGPFTMFAPTNDAFDRSTIDFNALTVNQTKDLLNYHIISGNHLSYELFKARQKETLLEGMSLEFYARYYKLYIKYGPYQSRVKSKNILTSTGVIHVVDAVLRIPGLPSM